MVIKRWFKEDRLKRFSKDFKFLLETMRQTDGEIELALRDNYFNLYYRGNSLAKVKIPANGNYPVTISNAFYLGSLASKDPQFLEYTNTGDSETILCLPREKLRPFFKKRYLADFRSRIRERNYCEETTYEQMVITDNRGRGDLLIIDRQVRDSTWGRMMDLLSLKQVEGNRYKFCVLEVKLGNNLELRGAVAEQLEDYVSHINEYFEDYKHCYEKLYLQKKQLRLVDHPDHPTIEIVEGAEGRILVFGYSGIARTAMTHLAEAHPKVEVQQFRFEI